MFIISSSRAPEENYPALTGGWSVSPRRAAGVPGEPCDHKTGPSYQGGIIAAACRCPCRADPSHGDSTHGDSTRTIDHAEHRARGLSGAGVQRGPRTEAGEQRLRVC
eukprot:7808959-Pyramimonas_sp.AAC.1